MVPKNRKIANVTAIFKKGSRHCSGNYRPVSLILHIYNVLESIFRDVILDHLKEFNLNNRSQHGFMRNRSCLTNILEFLDLSGVPVDVIYLDIQKAFDKVAHRKLLHKLVTYGIIRKVNK